MPEYSDRLQQQLHLGQASQSVGRECRWNSASVKCRLSANLAKMTTGAAMAIRAGCLPINFASSDALQLRQKRRIAPLGARFAYTLTGRAVVCAR